MKRATGHEGDVDAGVDRVTHRVSVGGWQITAAVEQRAVDVDRDEADRHCYGLVTGRLP